MVVFIYIFGIIGLIFYKGAWFWGALAVVLVVTLGVILVKTDLVGFIGLIGRMLFGKRMTKEEAEGERQRLREETRKIEEETRKMKPRIYFFDGVVVRLTDSGHKKVGQSAIYSTEEQVRRSGPYLYVTDRDSGKTYIFNPTTDVKSIDPE